MSGKETLDGRKERRKRIKKRLIRRSDWPGRQEINKVPEELETLRGVRTLTPLNFCVESISHLAHPAFSGEWDPFLQDHSSVLIAICEIDLTILVLLNAYSGSDGPTTPGVAYLPQLPERRPLPDHPPTPPPLPSLLPRRRIYPLQRKDAPFARARDAPNCRHGARTARGTPPRVDQDARVTCLYDLAPIQPCHEAERGAPRRAI